MLIQSLGSLCSAIRSPGARLLWCLGWLLAGLALAAPGVLAHPMGNFSINHYARFEVGKSQLSWRTVFDFAEIATAEKQAGLDTDGNGQVSAAEKAGFLQAQAGELRRSLWLSVDGSQADFTLRPVELSLRPGAGGLPILRMVFSSSLPWTGQPSGRARHAVAYRDSSFPGRTGWKEIVAQSADGASISQSSASPRDLSRELTVFPADATSTAPSQLEAAFTVTLGGSGTSGTSGPGTGAASSPGASGPRDSGPPEPSSRSGGSGGSGGSGSTPRNLFTQAIAQRDLSPGVMLLGVLVALAFGAVHALSPGHGKTMVAAYLVGTRGTPRHAALLGLVVTVTHTFGVFALGFITLFATNYIVPERLYPALSALSGLLILGVGFWLLMSRLQDLQHGHSHSHDGHSHDGHSHDGHSHDGHSHDGHSHDGHSHDHPHDDHPHDDDGHSHDHSHDGHSHDPDHSAAVHSHGGRSHSHAIPEGPVTARGLVALGISGGIVPCPEALVVLLAAVKMGRIGYGLLLISAFSVGLAAALIAIGLAVVAARRHMSRWTSLPVTGALARYLPLGSAAIITVIGITLTLQAMGGGAP